MIWTAYNRDPVLLKKSQRVLNNTRSRKKDIVAVAREQAPNFSGCGLPSIKSA
jgi:hypothetical protein